MTDRPAILGGVPVRPQEPPEWPRDDTAVRSVLLAMAESRDWGRYHGSHFPEFCRRLAEYHSVEHILPCSSGTAAVELALRGVGIVSGDEVILAGYDFKANFQNVLCLGATPVLVDLLPGTWQIDPNQIEAALSPKTRAILVSHLHGGVVDLHRVRQIVNGQNIAVIEDACQNTGALLSGHRSGTQGDVGVLSFGGSKLLTAGRGGAVLTARADIAERIKRHVQRGNEAYPLSEIQAAILLPQLEQLDEHNARRRDAVQRLATPLADLPGLIPLQLPTDEWQTTYYKVGFRYEAAHFGGLTRNQFVQSMRAEGIAFDAGFRSLHLIHASRRFRTVGTLPQATRADSEMLTLHHPVLLEPAAAIDEIAIALKRVSEWSTEIARLAPVH